MQSSPRFANLPDYAFPRLRKLLDGYAPGGPVLNMSIGEPQHGVPDFVGDVLAAGLTDFGKYPPNEGTPELRQAIAGWIGRRYGVALDAEHEVTPVSGTREGLFNAVLALCPAEKRGRRAAVLLPNPFYQCYAAAAAAAGAEAVFVPATAETGFLPDYTMVPEEILERTAMAFLCSPANPQGAVASRAYWRGLLNLAAEWDFQVLADECYGEIYRETPPPGVLEVAGADRSRVLAFHSLSKRSNLPGLRSGFVVGDAGAIAAINRLRSYGGAPMPLPVQAVSARAWGDEAHVAATRALYNAKFDLAAEVLGNLPGFRLPEAGFFLWLSVPDGEATALRLWRDKGLRVLPGSYLSRPNSAAFGGDDPGRCFVRAAMVAPIGEIARGLAAIRDVLNSNS
jgi:aspartate/methionine/tyrosine aminotransferase